MTRRLGDAKNVLRIEDVISGTIITMFYRQPTPKEMTEYNNKQIKRKRNKIATMHGEVRLEYGERILIGFKDGDFEKQVVGKDKKVKWVPIASDPDSKIYDPDWKKIVSKHAADLIMLLAVHVFDGSVTADDDEGLEGN